MKEFKNERAKQLIAILSDTDLMAYIQRGLSEVKILALLKPDTYANQEEFKTLMKVLDLLDQEAMRRGIDILTKK